MIKRNLPILMLQKGEIMSREFEETKSSTRRSRTRRNIQAWKQPFFLRHEGRAPVRLRGAVGALERRPSHKLFRHPDDGGNEVLRPVHDRMPVILHPEDDGLWLGAYARELELVVEVLFPYPAEEMVAHPIGAAVNSPRNQGPTLIERAAVNSA
jgi:putative SOS response-associated peptidase YedK